MMAVMIVAAAQSWTKGFFAMNGGIAPWSNLKLVALAVGAALVGAVGSLVVRRPAAAAR
jgi:hypothetical protein